MEPDKNAGHHHANFRHDATLKTLRDCAVACEKCAAACVQENDATRYAQCIALTTECASVCQFTAALLVQDCEIARSQLLACAEACKLTAAECSRHYNAHCQICATYCKACEQACQALHEDSL